MRDEEENEKIFLELTRIISELSINIPVSNIHKIMKNAYQVVQKCAIKVQSPHTLPKNHYETFFSFVESVITALTREGCSTDTLLIGCTSLAALISEIFDAEFSSLFLISLCNFMGEWQPDNKEDNVQRDISNKLIICLKDLSNECIEQMKSAHALTDFNTQDREVSKHFTPNFSQLALLHGILSCQKSGIFSLLSHSRKPFIITMFDLIHLSCLTPCCTQYHSFSVLVSWLKMCEKHLFEFPKVYFSTNSEILSKILSLLESNWESPIKGVSTFVKASYKLLIALSKSECSRFEIQWSLVEHMLHQIMNISWKVKGKYLVFAIILQFLDYKKFLEDYPDVPDIVISNLKANYASSVISEVYKSITSSMKSDDSMTSEWCRRWRGPIIKCLRSGDKLWIQNVTNLVLPWTLKIPGTYDLILNELTEDDIVPRLILLRVAKECGICTLRKCEIDILSKYIHHCDVLLRIEIMSVLCFSPKKSEALQPIELELLKKFISFNLNIDSSPFHQQFLSHMRILLIRIRDSLVQEHRCCKQQHSLKQLNNYQLEFVDWLTMTCVKGTFPGACFQRRRLSLHTIHIIFDVFLVSPQGNRRKEKPSKSIEDVIELAQKQNKWKFFVDDTLTNLFPCLTDFTDEVRSSAFTILSQFSSWPCVRNKSRILELQFVKNYVEILCNHPDYRSNDGGAHLKCLIYKSLQKEELLEFLRDIVKSANSQLEAAKLNFLEAAQSFPIHGQLLALQYCLKNTDEQLCIYSSEKRLSLFMSLFELCESVIQHMLLIMKGSDETDSCPSFSDIGEALSKLVTSSEHGSQLRDKTDTKAQHSTNIELLLSCCWHSIKNSCSLLCELCSCIMKYEVDYKSKSYILHNSANLLSTVLIGCRHRGVVDACSIALNNFCTLLIADETLYYSICMNLLNLIFDSLTEAFSTSVTRRSAGLPSLCLAVITSEKNNVNRRLLNFTVQSLLKFIHQPLPPTVSISEKTDLPQAHAFHILKALVTDSSLSQAILLHLDCVIPACISGFSSQLWTIRNGALQLFGVLLPRICGQKKVRDDDSEHNLVSASELFSRCPSLKLYLEQQFEHCVIAHQQRKLSSELIPMLSIIVKLSFPHDDKEAFAALFKSQLLLLLDTPVWKIRDLISSALSILMSEKDIEKELAETTQTKLSFVSNKIHGLLLVVKKILKRDLHFFRNDESLLEILMKIYYVKKEQYGFMLMAEIVEIFALFSHKNKNLTLASIENIFHHSSISDIDSVCFSHQIVILQLQVADRPSLPDLILSYSNKDIFIQNECLKFLSSKLLIGSEGLITSHNNQMWKNIFCSVLCYLESSRHPTTILEALKLSIDICQAFKIESYLLDSTTTESVVKYLQNHLSGKAGLSVAAYSLTLLSLCIKSDLHRNNGNCTCYSLTEWNALFNSYCQPRSCDILRMQASHSCSILGPSLVKYFCPSVESFQVDSLALLGIFEGTLLLLQDEDEEIRNKASEFPSNIPHNYQINCLQFNVAIDVIFQKMYESLHHDGTFVFYLWNRIQNHGSAAKILKSAENMLKVSLFEQEYVNVYAEPVQLLLKYRKYFMKSMEDLHKADQHSWSHFMGMFLIDLKSELEDLFDMLSGMTNLLLVEGFSFSHQIFLALIKLHIQVTVLESQEQLLHCMHLHTRMEQILQLWRNIQAHFSPITCWFFHNL